MIKFEFNNCKISGNVIIAILLILTVVLIVIFA